MSSTIARAALMVAVVLGTTLSACTSSPPDLSRLEGSWVEVDGNAGLRLNANGEGSGPFCVSSACFRGDTLPEPLVVKLDAFDEFLIEVAEEAPIDPGKILCGPCVLTNDDQHLSCKEAHGGFTTCEFNRQATATGALQTPSDAAVE